VVDPGRFTYSEDSPNLRRWFRGTAAHSTICVDGLDQTRYTRGRPESPVAEARFLGRVSRPGLDVLAGEARSPVYEAVHRRRVVFVRERYWILEDRLHGDRPHRYALRFQLPPAAAGRTRLDGASVFAPGLALVILGAAEVSLEERWVAPRYGHRLAAPAVRAIVSGACDATFVTLLAPLERDAPAPRLTRNGDVLDVDGLAMRRETLALGDGPLEVWR
jgi:hypothetical protein